MDLYLNDEAFAKAGDDLDEQSKALTELRKNIEEAFAQLKKDWQSDAGKEFFKRFEGELLKNLDNYAKVFEHMSSNVKSSSRRYEEVFQAADTVARSQF